MGGIIFAWSAECQPRLVDPATVGIEFEVLDATRAVSIAGFTSRKRLLSGVRQLDLSGQRVEFAAAFHHDRPMSASVIAACGRLKAVAMAQPRCCSRCGDLVLPWRPFASGPFLVTRPTLVGLMAVQRGAPRSGPKAWYAGRFLPAAEMGGSGSVLYAGRLDRRSLW